MVEIKHKPEFRVNCGRCGSNPAFGAIPSRSEIADLLNAFVGEAIASCPIGALRAGLALWIIDAFFMRASENAISQYHGAYLMLTEKVRDLLADDGVAPDVGSFGEPTLEQIGLTAFIRQDGDSDLCCQIRRRSVEGDGREGITSESAPDSLRQPRGGTTLDLLHPLK